MDVLLSTSPALLLAIIPLALVLGFVLGSKRSASKHRRLNRALCEKSLEALELKTANTKIKKYLDQAERKDKLVKLALKKNSALSSLNQQLSARLTQQEKQHFIAQSQLRLKSTEAQHQAQQALAIAHRANSQVQRLEAIMPSTQTIQAPPAKSYGQATAVKVKVVDQHPPKVQRDAISRVTNRDSAFLSQLRSSNETLAQATDNLQAIHGIDSPTERKLNKAGVYRVEQIANMSETELNELANTAGIEQPAGFRSLWKHGAQELMRQN